MNMSSGVELDFFGVKEKLLLREFSIDHNVVYNEKEITLTLHNDLMVEGTIGCRITLPTALLHKILDKKDLALFLHNQMSNDEKQTKEETKGVK